MPDSRQGFILNYEFPNGEYVITVALWGNDFIVVTDGGVYRMTPGEPGIDFTVYKLVHR